jgi:hypothetical protein
MASIRSNPGIEAIVSTGQQRGLDRRAAAVSGRYG